jgi:hypothetical protein
MDSCRGNAGHGSVMAESQEDSDPAKSLMEHENASCRGNAILNTESIKTDKKDKKDKKDKEVDASHQASPSPAATPPAARRDIVYTREFEQLWVTYPRREEDTKSGCWKLWQTALRGAEPVAIIAAAERWHAEHCDYEFRFGLRRWLKDRLWLEPIPPRRQAKSTDFVTGALRKLAKISSQQEDPTDETSFASVFEGTCDELPDEDGGSGADVVPFRGRGSTEVLGDERRAYPLSAAGSGGGLPRVAASKAWFP